MGGTILLADDSLTIQKVVELTFSDTEFTVIAVSTGDELLQRLPSARPDVVICDVIMPGRDGYDVCQQVKSNPATLQIPVVLLTGTFEPFDRDRALAAGCSEIISKPFEARKLVDVVERLVQQTRGMATAPVTPPPVEGAIRPPTFADEYSTPPPPTAPPWQTPPLPPPPAAASVEEFGTVAAAPPSTVEPQPLDEALEVDDLATSRGAVVAGDEATSAEEELDFTGSGFAEMEAAGRAAEVAPMVVPEEGLDFEPEPAFAGDLDAAAETAPAPDELPDRESPWADRSWDAPEPTTEAPEEEAWLERPDELGPTAAFDASEEAPFGESEDLLVAPWEESALAVEPPATAAAPFVEPDTEPPAPEPLADAPTPTEPFLPPAKTADEAPFTTLPMARLSDLVETAPEAEAVAAVEPPFARAEAGEEPWLEQADEPEGEVETAPAPEPSFAGEEAVEEPWSEPVAEPEEVAAAAFAPEPPVAMATAPAEEEVVEEEAPAPEVTEPRADTQPSIAVAAAPVEGRLSDEDVERVARRVVELARHLLEQVAWEVIPDMAEIVVRERIRQIEAEAGPQQGESLQ